MQSIHVELARAHARNASPQSIAWVSTLIPIFFPTTAMINQNAFQLPVVRLKRVGRVGVVHHDWIGSRRPRRQAGLRCLAKPNCRHESKTSHRRAAQQSKLPVRRHLAFCALAIGESVTHRQKISQMREFHC